MEEDMKAHLEGAQQWSGYGKMSILQTMKQYGFTDPYFAAAYIQASSLAVMIYGNRHKWNMNRAKTIIENMD